MATELDAEQREAAVLLAEEACEVGQELSKLQRFGLGLNPYDGVSNTVRLSRELGQLLANIDIAIKYGLVLPKIMNREHVERLKDYSIDERRPQHLRRLRHVSWQLKEQP